MMLELSPLSNSRAPSTLYHYTSLEALVSIVTTRRLRATNIRFLNDTSEVNWLRKHVADILRSSKSLHMDEKRLKAVAEVIDRASPQSLFVSSFSERENDLSQWRAYCPTGVGVCIGFSTNCLIEHLIYNPAAEDKPFYLGTFLNKVIYYSPEKESELRELIEGYLKTASTWSPDLDDEAIRKWQQDAIIPAWLRLKDHYVKHFAFEEEAEWRKVITKDYRLMPGQQFRQAKSTLVPFVEICLDLKTVEAKHVAQDKYFIDKVIVGPTPNPELTIESVNALFATEGQDQIPVIDCGIPYKDW